MAKKQKLSASWWQAAQLLGFQDMTSSPPTEASIVAELGSVMRKYAKTQVDLYKNEERRRILFKFYLDVARELGWDDPIMQSPSEERVVKKLRDVWGGYSTTLKTLNREIAGLRQELSVAKSGMAQDAWNGHPGFGKADAIFGAAQKLQAVAESYSKPQTLVGRVERLERHVGL